MHRTIPGVCAIPGYPGIYDVGISQDMVGFNCVNTSGGPSVHHTSPPSSTCRVRERSNISPASRSVNCERTALVPRCPRLSF
eukprot:705103-Prymnesium_polylepis.1